MLHHPNIDPIAFSIGPLAVRWYGLMYLLGFVAGWWLGIRRIQQGLAPVTRQQLDDLLFLVVLGVILGGRLGYVLFYKPGHYLSHPIEIFYIWQGGMSFHGGLLGVMLAMTFAARKHGIPWLGLMDYVAPLIPPGTKAWCCSHSCGGSRPSRGRRVRSRPCSCSATEPCVSLPNSSASPMPSSASSHSASPWVSGCAWR
jgi:prolipoprotein diacylglyceryl transferase